MARRESDTFEPYRPPGPPGGVASSDDDAEHLSPPRASDPEGALWRRWCYEADAAARALLVERHMPYARALAARLYSRRPHDDIEFDDYLQYAMVGLVESVDRYSPERGAKFTTFAMTRINGAILNGLGRLTERQQQIAFRRRLAAERIASLVPDALSTDPTEQLLADLAEIGVGVALGVILEGTGMVLGQPDELPGDAYAHARAELRQLHERLWGLMDRLTEREREIIELHYRRGKRFDEIAEKLGLTKGRISQLHKQAVLRLRALMNDQETCDVAY